MRKVHAQHGRDHHPDGSDPIPGLSTSALSYAYCSMGGTMAAVSQEITAYDEAYSYGPGFSLDGSNRIVVEETGVYLAILSVDFPLATSEEFNAYVRLSSVDLTPPTGTLVPDALGFWAPFQGIPDAAGDFFRAGQHILPFALADAADTGVHLRVDLNKATATSRSINVAVYCIRFGDARTS